MLTCDKCGAVCKKKHEEKRFQRRHPKKCVQHEKFHAALAAGTVSVDYDDELAKAVEWNKQEYNRRHGKPVEFLEKGEDQ
jgi:adenine-specific DNA methylase